MIGSWVPWYRLVMAKPGRKPLDKDGSTQISLRLPDSWLAEVDERIAEDEAEGIALTRVNVLRMLVRRGLDAPRKKVTR